MTTEIEYRADAALYPLARALAHVLFPYLGGVRVFHREFLPRKGGVLIAANHISDLDPPVIGYACLPRVPWYMAKRELFGIRLLGGALRHLRSFPVDRDSPDRRALRFAEWLLEREQAVVMFPEGRLSEDGRLRPMSSGVGLLALRTGKPILPALIQGTNRFIPYGEVIPRRAGVPATVSFGEAFHVLSESGVSRRELVGQAVERLREAYLKLAETTPRPLRA